MRHEIGDIVFTIQKLKSYENDTIVSHILKNAAEDEANMLTVRLAEFSVSELVDFIVNFEGF
jgi:hypothetical protein